MSNFDASQYVKSPWLHGSDLPPGQTIVTIKAAREHEFERDGSVRPVLTFVELREEMTLNKSQVRALIGMFGPNAGAWIGQQVALMPAPSNYPDKPTIAILPVATQPPPMRFESTQPTQAQTKPVRPEVNFR